MPSLIGRSPNQVPVNGMLGTAAFVDLQQIPQYIQASIGLQLIATGTVNGVSTLNITNIPTYKRLVVVLENNTFALTDQVIFKPSVDNGATFPGGGFLAATSSVTPTVVPVYLEITASDISYKKRYFTYTGGTGPVAMYVETQAAINAAAINAVRLYAQSGNNFTAATYYLYGEN